jgi:3-hydroxy-3-methylglutaryl CoA synthase
MTGITSVGAYIPMYRLDREEIGRMWHMRGTGGEKAVAGYDEDSVTMAVAAALECTGRLGRQPDGLYMATTTAPYKEKQHAALVASALDLDRSTVTADITNSLRAATTGLRAALDAVRAGSSRECLVVAADCRLGAPRGKFEQLLGDGAGALTIGSDDVLAEIEEVSSLYSEFTDVWRTDSDAFPRSGEGRFIEEVGYMPTMMEAVSALMKKSSSNPADFARIVFYAHDLRQHTELAKKLGFQPSQVQDPFFTTIGNTGAAATFIMLAACLEAAQPGDRILLAGYGDGADVFTMRVTDNIKNMQQSGLPGGTFNHKRNIDYGTYLNWRDLVPFEASSLPERPEPSLASRWRERKLVSSLYGVRCTACGTPQLHPIGQNIRICVACQAKDTFEPYKFADKRGILFTYAVDQLQPTKNPPGLNGVIDFEDGGRLLCELTDYDVKNVRIGMPVKMTFRRLSSGKGVANYFWKARPIADNQDSQ